MDLKDKVIIITGATGGMAQEIAKILSEKGCKLALFARREEILKKMCKDLTNSKTKCIYKKCDQKNQDEVISAVKYVKKTFGRVDVAILSAGILMPIPIQIFDSKPIKNSMEINFMGTVYFIEELLKIMKKQKSGTMAVVSTLPDKRGVAGWSTYGASKAALSWLLESLRAEAKQRYNINIISIKPGSVQTPMIEDFPRHGAMPAKKAAEVILKGIEKNKKVVQFPFMEVLFVRVKDQFPAFAYDLFPVEESKGKGYPQVDEE